MPNQTWSNHEAYVERHKERLEPEHSGKLALMHDGEVIEILDSQEVAYELGMRRYGKGNFSLEGIGAVPFPFGAVTFAFD